MYLHANAKLGLAVRFALVQAIEGGCSIRNAAVRFNVSPATAHRWWHRWREAGEEARATLACLFDRSSRPRRSPRELLGPGEDTGRLRLRARDRRRSHEAGLCRAPGRRARPDGDRFCRAGALRLRRTRDRAETADDRQRLELHQEPLLARAARPTRDPPSHHETTNAPHQRQSRAFPSNDGTRVGLRPPLPHPSTPRRSAATLARALQPAQTAQLNRGPTPNQPRSQRLWVGQLVATLSSHFLGLTPNVTVADMDSRAKREAV